VNKPQKVDDLTGRFRAELDVGWLVRHESLYKPSPLFQGKFPGKLQRTGNRSKNGRSLERHPRCSTWGGF
jgi:hypothetical protein